MNKNYFHAMSESDRILVEFTLSYVSIRKWNLFSTDMSLFMACTLQFALLHLMDWSLRLCKWVAQNWRTLTSFDNQQPALTNDVDISFEVGRIKNIALSQWGKWKT